MLTITNVQNLKGMLLKLFLLSFVTTLFFTSCQKEGATQMEEKIQSKEEKAKVATEKLTKLLDEHEYSFNFEELEKNAYENNTAESRNKLPYAKAISEIVHNPHFKQHLESMRRAINPEDYECGPTFFHGYIGELLEDLTPMQADIIFDVGFTTVLIESALFNTNFRDQYFGKDGEYTRTMHQTFLKLKRFWDIPTDINLVDMHGTVFKNAPLVAQILIIGGYGRFDEEGNYIPITPEEAIVFAEFLKEIFSAEVFQDYNHPLFSLNAVAIDAIPELGLIPTIAMGDGLMEAYRSFGLRTTAERLILAHEYGHQIQYATRFIGENEGASTPERTREIELMADAYAAYFLSHGEGLFTQQNLLERTVTTGFSIGDCGFSSPGHHGTPNQRAAAVAFGANLAKRTGLIDTKYTSKEFEALFLEALPGIVAPDAN